MRSSKVKRRTYIMEMSKQKKCLTHSSNSEQCKPRKKTRFDSSNFLVSLKHHIGLKWDQHLRRVVPAKEQVAIAWSNLAPFIESHKQHHSGLADVVYVPPEIFALQSLRDVLSYEVWSTCLTEAERKFLIHFLPSVANVEENVHLLFAGKNHHFQNPFLSWSSSLCDGDIHPDAILNKEKHMKQDEKAYCIDLNIYHSNIIGSLTKWRNRWLSCSDTEDLFRDNPGNQIQGVQMLNAIKSGMPLLKVPQSVDVLKFMSYIEISRTQLNQIKRLKRSGDDIQINQVSRVIGGLDKSHVKPYGVLLEAEQRRLHGNWLNMSCNDLPTAFDVLKNRQALMEKSRKLLSLDLEEKNASVSRKAVQLPDIRKELGQPGASKNDGILVLQNDQTEYLPQTMLQGGKGISSIDHINSLNSKDQDLMVKGTGMTSQGEHDFDVQDQDHNGVKCLDKGISCCSSNPDGLNKDVTATKLCKHGLGVNDEDIKGIICKDTIPNAESHRISSMHYTSPHINTIDRKNMQTEDLGGVCYKGPSVDVHEQDQDLESISHGIVNHSCSHSANVSSEMRQGKMNAVTVDQEENNNVMMVPQNSSSLLLKSSEEQMRLEDFLDPSVQVLIGEKDQWQLAGHLQSHYHPPENITYSGFSDDLQIKQQYLSSGQQSSSIYLDNAASITAPFSNLQNNDQLQTANNIGAASYRLQHAMSMQQSTSQQPVASNCLAQSAPFPGPLLEQQLTGSADGIYAQLHEDYYACGNGLTLPRGSSMDGTLPGGSSMDGTLFSAIAQYKQASAADTGYGGARTQVSLPQNFLPRTQDPNTPFPNMYGDSYNMADIRSRHAASDVGSLDNMRWTNFTEQNPGIPPDFTKPPF